MDFCYATTEAERRPLVVSVPIPLRTQRARAPPSRKAFLRNYGKQKSANDYLTQTVCKIFLRHEKACDKIIVSLKWLFDRHRRCGMAVSYNKLWKILIDRGMNKTQFCERAKISTNAMAKLGRNEDARVEVLTKICVELGGPLDDIMEIITEE